MLEISLFSMASPRRNWRNEVYGEMLSSSAEIKSIARFRTAATVQPWRDPIVSKSPKKKFKTFNDS